MIKNKEKYPKPEFFIVLDLLCELLNQHISKARSNLVKSSMHSPMYGILQSIRAAYGCLGASTFRQHCHHHREAMANVVSICDDIAKLVSPVVCSSSPEGFLPSDSESLISEHQSSLASQGSIQTQAEPSGSQDSAESAPHGNAQSLLLCCWHSMKEIALLLGYLTECAPVVSDSSIAEKNGVITHSQVCSV